MGKIKNTLNLLLKMENTKKDKETKEPEEVNILQSRVEINKVIIETPSLLNMIKHCQDKKGRASVAFLLAGNTGVQGSITGVIKTELGQNNIYVNNCIPDGSKQTRATLNQLRGEQAESKRKTETITRLVSTLHLSWVSLLTRRT